MSQGLEARNRDPFTDSPRGSTLLQDTFGAQRGVTEFAQADAIQISSDSDSDYGDYDGSKSDTLLPLGALFPRAVCEDTESGSPAGPDQSPDDRLRAGGGVPVETAATEKTDSVGEISSTQQQQLGTIQCSPISSSSPALPRPLSTCLGLPQAEQNRPLFANSIEDTTYDKMAKETACPSTPGTGAQHPPSPYHLSNSSLPLQDGVTLRECTPQHDPAGEDDSSNGAQPSFAKLKPGRKRNVAYHGVRRSARISRANPNDEDGYMEQDSNRRHRGRTFHTNMEDEGTYHPDISEGEQGNESEYDIWPPQHKRLRINSPAQPARIKATGRRMRPYGVSSQPRQAQEPACGRKYSGNRSIPSPPSSHGHSDEETTEAHAAKFKEWPLEDAVLKRVTVNGLATFQLQFTWDTCANHSRGVRATGSPLYNPPAKKGLPARLGPGTRNSFTLEEDNLIVKLKSQELHWKEIYRQFGKTLPGRKRSMAALQVRFSTKLNKRTRNGPPEAG
ncbi:hypothetical protein F4677DRAFT_363085 [Hypoxylon crocopeplum]|nr:hypothetical protein F4677DRAFT_363085 [Hypoxylon crocopeplum]